MLTNDGAANDHSFIFSPSLSLFTTTLQHVDPVVISQKVIQGVYAGVTTMELDE
jgi:hypothetical protein